MLSCPEFTAGLAEDAEFLAGNIEGYMSKTALAGEQKAIRRKMCERWLQSFPNDIRSFNRVAPLVDHAQGQVAVEIPLFPKLHQIVTECAVLQTDFINLDCLECGYQVGIFGEVDTLSPGIAAADV